jgi:hypothetical protein
MTPDSPVIIGRDDSSALDPRRDGESNDLPFVAVMKAADLRNLDDRTWAYRTRREPRSLRMTSCFV